MGVVIRKRVKVAPGGTVTISDSSLHPGEQVEVVVRVVASSESRFLGAVRGVHIDALPDYSVSFEVTRTRKTAET